MAKLPPREGQLGLDLDDRDLRKPEHDMIMHWLDSFVRDEANVRRFVKPQFDSRRCVITYGLDDESKGILASASSNQQRRMRVCFQEGRRYDEAAYFDQWDDEPPRSFELKEVQWELPLTLARRASDRACDLFCRYEVGSTLLRVMTHVHKFDNAAPSVSRIGLPQWTFTKIGETQSWKQQTTDLRLFFEVKTAIASVGDLMRQLQIYRASKTFREASHYGTAVFVVVAPPHNEAASVCRGHGIEFLEYRPVGASRRSL